MQGPGLYSTDTSIGLLRRHSNNEKQKNLDLCNGATLGRAKALPDLGLNFLLESWEKVQVFTESRKSKYLSNCGEGVALSILPFQARISPAKPGVRSCKNSLESLSGKEVSSLADIERLPYSSPSIRCLEKSPPTHTLKVQSFSSLIDKVKAGMSHKNNFIPARRATLGVILLWSF